MDTYMEIKQCTKHSVYLCIATHLGKSVHRGQYQKKGYHFFLTWALTQNLHFLLHVWVWQKKKKLVKQRIYGKCSRKSNREKDWIQFQRSKKQEFFSIGSELVEKYWETLEWKLVMWLGYLCLLIDIFFESS